MDPSAKPERMGTVRFEHSPTHKTTHSGTDSLERSPSKMSRSPSKRSHSPSRTDRSVVDEEDLKTLQYEIAKAKKEEQTREREEAEQRAKKKGVDRILLYNRLDRTEIGVNHLLNFWLYLWAPDEKGNCCPNINIRNTIVVIDGQPRTWLFQTKDGSIKKMSAERVRDGREDMFLKIKRECEEKNGAVSALHMTVDSSNGAMFNVLTEKELKQLLASKEPIANGVIVSYVRPFGDSDLFISATWSRNFFTMERATMVPKLKGQRRVDIANPSNMCIRTIPDTEFEGRSLMETKLANICDGIARHITNVSPQKYHLESMRVHFKQDEYGNMWVLGCSVLELVTQKGEHKFSGYRALTHPQNNFKHVPEPTFPLKEIRPLTTSWISKPTKSRKSWAEETVGPSFQEIMDPHCGGVRERDRPATCEGKKKGVREARSDELGVMTWRCTPADYRDRRARADPPLGPPPPSLYRNGPRPSTTGCMRRPRLPYSVISGSGQVAAPFQLTTKDRARTQQQNFFADLSHQSHLGFHTGTLYALATRPYRRDAVKPVFCWKPDHTKVPLKLRDRAFKTAY